MFIGYPNWIKQGITEPWLSNITVLEDEVNKEDLKATETKIKDLQRIENPTKTVLNYRHKLAHENLWLTLQNESLSN